MTNGVNFAISGALKVEITVYYTKETQVIRDGLSWVLFRQYETQKKSTIARDDPLRIHRHSQPVQNA